VDAELQRCAVVQVNMLEALLMLSYYGVFVLYIAFWDSSAASPMHIEDSHHYQDVVRVTSAQTSQSLTSYPVAPSPLGLASQHALPERAEVVQVLGAAARTAASLSGGLSPFTGADHGCLQLQVEVLRPL
jgi:hypothetical protein